MARNYLKLAFLACFIVLASQAHAQFRFGDKSSIGQTQIVDTETGVATFSLDFNTDRPNSTWTQDTSGLSISFSKCQTNRGFRSEVFESDDPMASTIFNDDFKVRRWNSNENPVHMASIDSLMAIFDKWAELHAGTEDETKNVIWKPSACLFDVDGDDTNQAFGTHPGQYKRVEYGWQFNFSSFAVTSDISFDIFTYDEGNTGQTATYDLIVAVGGETDTAAVVPGLYVTGSPMLTVNLADVTGLNFADFSNKKVYFWLKTQGTGTPIAMDSFDPTVVFDNMTVNYQVPLWIAPPAGAEGNAILDNMDSPFVAPFGEATTTSMLLQTVSRYGKLEITNDMLNRANKIFDFPETGALFANDGNGNYNVEVPYTLEPAIFDAGSNQWSKAKISVDAPEEGPVNDDMMFFFDVTPSTTAVQRDRLELNSGTRIWFDYHIQGTPPAGGNLLFVGALGPDAEMIVASDSVIIVQLQAAGYGVTLVDDNLVGDGGYDYSPYDAVVFGESCSSSRVVGFGTVDGYPIPCLMMEPLAVRTDKWGWVVNPDPGTFGNSDYPGFKQDNDCQAGTTDLEILNNTHYVTQDYNDGAIVPWTTAICGDPESVFAFGFDLNQDMSGGYGLVKNTSAGISQPNLWVLPAGTTVTGGTTLTNRLVVFGIHELGIYGKDDDMTEYATSDFYNLMLRSVEWILGAGEDGPAVGTRDAEVLAERLLVYPNPLSQVAKLQFESEASGQANLFVVDMVGKRTQVLSNHAVYQGENQIQINLQSFAEGMYIYQLETGGKLFTGKLLIAR